MASNFTEHFQLNQWEPGDQVLRADFNEDNAKIDAAIHGKVRMVSGHYQGTGEYGADHPTVIEVPDAERPPQVIFVSEDRGWYHFLLIRGMTGVLMYANNGYTHTDQLTWTDKGVSWYSVESSFYQMNSNTLGYRYAVLI